MQVTDVCVTDQHFKTPSRGVPPHPADRAVAGSFHGHPLEWQAKSIRVAGAMVSSFKFLSERGSPYMTSYELLIPKILLGVLAGGEARRGVTAHHCRMQSAQWVGINIF